MSTIIKNKTKPHTLEESLSQEKHNQNAASANKPTSPARCSTKPFSFGTYFYRDHLSVP